MADKKQQRMATALSFANLGLEQNAQAERANAARVAQAMQMLQIQQQAAQDQARQEQAMQMLQLNRDELGVRESELGFKREQATADRDMSNWQATDASQRAWQGVQAEQGQRDMQNWAMTDASQRGWDANNRAGADQSQGINLGVLKILSELAGTGQPINPAVGAYIKQAFPQAGGAIDAGAQAMEADKIAKFAALGVNPDGTPLAPAALPAQQQPRVGGLTYNGPTIQDVGVLGLLGDIIKTGVMPPPLPVGVTPEEARKRDMESPWNPLNILFGRK